MSSLTIAPIGTELYLKRDLSYTLYLKPDVTLKAQPFIVKYDCRINGITVVPRGTQVVGEWISLSVPSTKAYLKLTLICDSGSYRPISAVSGEYTNVALFNSIEVNNVSHLYNIMTEKSSANKIRRIVEISCQTKILVDRNVDSPYIEIPTNEIVVTLDADLV